MAIFSISVVVILHIFSLTITVDESIEREGIALQLSQEEIESIRAASTYADIDSYAMARGPVSGGFDAFEKEVLIGSDPKQVAVTVYWEEKGVEQSLSLTTLISDFGF